MDVYVQVEKSGRLELPADILSQLGISEGDLLAVRVENGSLVLIRSDRHQLPEPSEPANDKPSAKLGWKGQVLVVESPLTCDPNALLDQLRDERVREAGSW